MVSRMNRGGAFGAVGSGWLGGWNLFFDFENRMEPCEWLLPDRLCVKSAEAGYMATTNRWALRRETAGVIGAEIRSVCTL